MLKKILTWGGVAFLVFFIAYRPTSAANVAHTLGSTIGDVGNGIGNFISSLVA